MAVGGENRRQEDGVELAGEPDGTQIMRRAGDDPVRMAAAPVRRFGQPLLGQMQPDTIFLRQRGIIGDQERRDALKLFSQHGTRLVGFSTNDDKAARWQAARGGRPVGIAAVGEQHQGHVRVETLLLLD